MANYALESYPGRIGSDTSASRYGIDSLFAALDVTEMQREALLKIASSSPKTVNKTLNETLDGMKDPRRYLEVLTDRGLVRWVGTEATTNTTRYDVLWLSKLGMVVALLEGAKFAGIERSSHWVIHPDDPFSETLKAIGSQKLLTTLKRFAPTLQRTAGLENLFSFEVWKDLPKLQLFLGKDFVRMYGAARIAQHGLAGYSLKIKSLNHIQERIIRKIATSGPQTKSVSSFSPPLTNWSETLDKENSRIDSAYFDRTIRELVNLGLLVIFTDGKKAEEKVWLTYLGGLQAVCLNEDAENILKHAAELSGCSQDDPKMRKWLLLRDVAKEHQNLLVEGYSLLKNKQTTKKIKPAVESGKVFEGVELLAGDPEIAYSSIYTLSDNLSVAACPRPYVLLKTINHEGIEGYARICETDQVFKALPGYKFGNVKPSLVGTPRLLETNGRSIDITFKIEYQDWKTFEVKSRPPFRLMSVLKKAERVRDRPTYAFEFDTVMEHRISLLKS